MALALGFDGTPLALAELCQRAEQRASGVPCGIMDQLASAAGVAGHALRIDCTSLEVRPVPMPDDIEVVVVDSGQRRELATSAYAERAAACQAAQRVGGTAPRRAAWPTSTPSETRRSADERATSSPRTPGWTQLVDALGAGDRAAMADSMAASHRSLRDDFEVSTPVLDAARQRADRGRLA